MDHSILCDIHPLLDTIYLKFTTKQYVNQTNVGQLLTIMLSVLA
jgi:hypothetical protein